MPKFYYIFLVALVCFPLWATDPIKVKDLTPGNKPTLTAEEAKKRSRCLNAILDLIETTNLDGDDPNDIAIGGLGKRYEGLDGLMVEVGMLPIERLRVLHTLRKVENSTTFEDRLLHENLAAMNDPERQGRLFVCLAPKTCQITDGAEGQYVAHYKNFTVIPFAIDALKKGNKKPAPGANSGKSKNGIETHFQAILIKYQYIYAQKYRDIAFAGTLHHDFRHFLDDEVLDEWILDNRELIRRGEAPDELFKDYVRVIPAKKAGNPDAFVMDLGFVTAFRESRGYQVTAQVTKKGLPPEKYAEMEGQIKDKAYEDIEEAMGQDVMLRFDVKSSADVFKVGEKIEAIFNETAKKANRADRKKRAA